MHKLIVTNQSVLASLEISGVEIVSPKNYFIQERFSKLRNVRVFNLCRDYSYQSKGYYVSLLAEARGHKPLPDVKNLQDIKTSSIIKSLTDDLDELIQRSLKNIKSKEFILSVYFGQNVAIQHDKLSLELHKLFSVPLFRARFIFIEKWVLQCVKTIGMKVRIKLNNNAHQKLRTEKPITIQSANKMIMALITNKNSPNVNFVTGMVYRINKGFTNWFSNASASATKMALRNPSMITPGNK